VTATRGWGAALRRTTPVVARLSGLDVAEGEESRCARKVLLARVRPPLTVATKAEWQRIAAGFTLQVTLPPRHNALRQGWTRYHGVSRIRSAAFELTTERQHPRPPRHRGPSLARVTFDG